MKKEKPPRGGLFENRSVFDQGAAAFFRFLRQPSRPKVGRYLVILQTGWSCGH